MSSVQNLHCFFSSSHLNALLSLWDFPLWCRIQMSVFLSGTTDAGVQTQKLFPLYILLARLVSPKPAAEVGVWNLKVNLIDHYLMSLVPYLFVANILLLLFLLKFSNCSILQYIGSLEHASLLVSWGLMELVKLKPTFFSLIWAGLPWTQNQDL